MTTKKKVCLFWDNSNIYISAKNAARERESVGAHGNLRIQFENLFKVATAGREVTRAYCVGSVPPDLEVVWKRLTQKTGVTPELFERGKGSGKEQGIDQCLQVWMLRCSIDIQPPQVAVLLTGDGAGYQTGAGFHADLERMHKAGWGIEVVTWDAACAGKLRTWATTAGIYLKLEDYYASVTYMEGGRTSTPVNLKKRRVATPKEQGTADPS
ncbi:MAG: NYN domain-containing protein [Planctomycetota bacterium]|nr:NYN domain-containing protein [Planctomycetota bacterium]